ncbi:MAG: RsmB/NOP family class I SAM-dependent RNA methyltransferase [Verrucomicrobiota bacterium]|nr:RsmB/NOP family class I SAM-dependent RNA methyltransferase [Verrucomicrobiota bacterium]
MPKFSSARTPTRRPAPINPLDFSIAHALCRIATAVLGEGSWLDRELRLTLKENHWHPQQRTLAVKAATAWIRHARLIDALAEALPKDTSSRWQRGLAVLPIVFPEFVIPGLPFISPGVKTSLINRLKELRGTRAIRESVPEWLDALGEKAYGPRWDALLKALNQSAPLYLRVNRHKASRDLVAGSLASEQIDADPVDGTEDALRVYEHAAIFESTAFKEGQIEIQDIGSQAVAPFVLPQPGQRILDACAGQGGKTIHLATFMNNRGKIIASDSSEARLKALKIRLRRASVDVVEIRADLHSVSPDRFRNKFDRVLLDVPCTGTGALRRNPGLKWSLDAATLERLVVEQARLLRRYAQAVKPGGYLVYATCSILPQENTEQIQKFLADSKGAYELEAEQQLAPDTHPGDGFYMARMKRVAPIAEKPAKPAPVSTESTSHPVESPADSAALPTDAALPSANPTE